MRCNACWVELEGRAVTTTCGHLLCPEDADKIISNDGACPICNQVLSKSLMRPIDINPNDEWINMAMAGVSPQILMKSAYRSVSFYIGQKELEMQFKMNKVVAQCRQKCEAMQEKFTEKLEQIYTAYQKMGKQCQAMEQQIESLLKDKQELQEKFAEKCRQKRKLDEMYDLARTEIESLKRSAIQPVNQFFPRREPDLFSNASPRMMDDRDSIRRGPREDIWPAKHHDGANSGGFNISSGSPGKQFGIIPNTKMAAATATHSGFGVGNGPGTGNNPSMTLRNLILSPIKRSQLSRSRSQLFTL